MYCSKCGTQNADGTHFCVSCGADLALVAGGLVTGQPVPPPPLPVQGTPAPQPAPQYGAQPQQQPYGGGQQQYAQQQYGQQFAQQQYAQQQQAQQPKISASKCLSEAWSDIKATPDWLTRLLVLGLINIVPVLNFVVTGFLYQWARDLTFGKREPLPKKIFGDGTFMLGVYLFVVGIVAGFALAIVDTILGFIPILGWLAIVALSIAIVPLLSLCFLRVSIFNRIGAAFDFSKVWNTAKKDIGGLIVVTFVPSLVVGIALSIIGGIFTAIAFGIAGFNAYSLYYGDFGAIIALIAGAIIIYFVFWVITMIVETFVSALIYRALGYWVSHNAPEWAAEALAGQQGTQGGYYRVN